MSRLAEGGGVADGREAVAEGVYMGADGEVGLHFDRNSVGEDVMGTVEGGWFVGGLREARRRYFVSKVGACLLRG